jgi:hypothetical protein
MAITFFLLQSFLPWTSIGLAGLASFTLGLYCFDVEESFHLHVFLFVPSHLWQVLHTGVAPIHFPPLPSLPPPSLSPPAANSLQRSNTYPLQSSLPLVRFDDGEAVGSLGLNGWTMWGFLLARRRRAQRSKPPQSWESSCCASMASPSSMP